MFRFFRVALSCLDQIDPNEFDRYGACGARDYGGEGAVADVFDGAVDPCNF